MDVDQYASQWNWRRLRDGWGGNGPDDGDLQEDSYAVLPKRNGKFFVKAYRPGGAEARLPFQDFESLEEAQRWCVEREHRRQADASREHHNEIRL